jgi:hypothetical protein
MFLKDSNGNKSASLTMLIISFSILMIWLSLSIFKKIAGIEIREFDAGAAMALLTPIAGLYFGRRFTLGNNSNESEKLESKESIDKSLNGKQSQSSTADN